ncbi:MAG: hypothetical protein RR327_06750, partial [Clostridia bacterium]
MKNKNNLLISMKHRRQINSVIYNVFMILLCVVIMFPVVWTMSASLKTDSEIYSDGPLDIIPNNPTLDNFKKIYSYYDV